jgi:hypothetical protein
MYICQIDCFYVDDNFEVVFYENPQLPRQIDFNYGTMNTRGEYVTVGVQNGGGTSGTIVGCNAGGLVRGLQITLHTPLCAPSVTPTATRPRVTPTATRRPPDTCYDYQINVSEAPAAAIQERNDTGNHCDNCITPFQLPFPVRFYDRTYNVAYIGSNGTVSFGDNVVPAGNLCLPTGRVQQLIMAYWDDLDTSQVQGGFGGVYYQVTSDQQGNRLLDLEWEALNKSNGRTVGFIVRLYENSPTRHFSILYTATDGTDGSGATAGVQEIYNPSTQLGRSAQYSCNQPDLTVHTLLHFDYLPCPR